MRLINVQCGLLVLFMFHQIGNSVRILGTIVPKCYKYTSITNTTVLTDFTGHVGGMNNLTADWYRVDVTKEGVMVRECPRGNECGTKHQAWLLDAIPSYTKNTTTNVTVCIRDDRECCARNISIQMVNCYLYLVYYLIPLTGDERYCFYAETQQFQPVKRNSSTLATVGEKTDRTTIITVSSILAIIIVAILIIKMLFVIRKRLSNKNRVLITVMPTQESA